MDFSTYSPAMDPNRIAPPSGPPASDQRKGRYSLDTPFKVPYNFAVPITVSIPVSRVYTEPGRANATAEAI
jgi:hypothetical protein